MKRFFMILAGLMMIGLVCNVADAAVSRKTTYKENLVWRCAVRFIRVDQNYKILEKDKDSGYLLFEYTEGGRTYMGAVEILPVIENSKKYVRIQLRIQDQPSYVESVLYNKLARKLKNEYGTPPLPESIVPAVNNAPIAKEKTDDGENHTSEELPEDDLEVTEDDLNESVEE